MRLTRLGASWAASVVFHAAMMGGLGWLVAAHALRNTPLPVPPPDPDPPVALGNGLVDIDLPGFQGNLIEPAETNPDGIPPTPSGGETIARIDTNNAGQGGGPALEKAIHHADRDEAAVLSPDLVNRLDRDQVQRIKS